MTPESFLAWRERMGLNAVQAAAAIGCTRDTIRRYERGGTPIPRYIALACRAIANGLAPMA